jgi:phage terminase small subunit
LLRNVKVKKYIEERLAKKEAERIAKQDEILEFYTTVMRDDEEDTRERIKAADSLAKTYAMFKQDINLTGDLNHSIDLSYMSNEELDEELKKYEDE